METVFMYMDESGDGGLPAPHGASTTKHMVYAGAVINGEQNFELKKQVQELLNKYFDDDERPEELHYGDIINDRGIYGELDGITKKAISDDVFEVIKDISPTIISTVIDKKKHGNKYVDPWSPKPYIFRSTIGRFQYYVDDHDCVGIAIADSEQSFIDDTLREIVYDAKSDGIRVVEEGSKLTNIMDSVLFTPSEMSPGIQIADFIAYAIWCHYEYGNSRRYNEIKHLFRNPSGTRFTEPSLLPK